MRMGFGVWNLEGGHGLELVEDGQRDDAEFFFLSLFSGDAKLNQITLFLFINFPPQNSIFFNLER